MTEYEVEIITRVREIYVVEASSEREARDTWHRVEPEASECIEVEEITRVEEVEG